MRQQTSKPSSPTFSTGSTIIPCGSSASAPLTAGPEMFQLMLPTNCAVAAIFSCESCVGVTIDGSGKWRGAPSGKSYGIKITVENPDGASQDEINAVTSRKGQDRAPDVLDLGSSFAISACASA